jgi:hypothetical protein
MLKIMGAPNKGYCKPGNTRKYTKIRLIVGVFRAFGGYRYQLLLKIAILLSNEVSQEIRTVQSCHDLHQKKKFSCLHPKAE